MRPNAMSSRHKTEAGFTLIEILTVVAIMGILLAVAIPNIAGFLRNYRVRGAAQQVASELGNARGLAISKNAMLGVVLVILDNRTYRIVIEDDMVPPIVQTRQPISALIGAVGCSTGAACPQAGPVRTLPVGCTFATTGGPTVKGLRFNNLGGVCEPGTTGCPAIDTGLAQLIADGAGGWKVTIQSVTGMSRDVDVSPAGRIYTK